MTVKQLSATRPEAGSRGRAAAGDRMTVRLGPYPLCAACQRTNGGLTHVRHPQRHIEAHGQAACVDEDLADLLVELWAVCETRSCCQDEGGRAYVTPTRETRTAVEAWLVEQGIPYAVGERGRVWLMRA